MILHKMRPAFTFIELTFAMIILGIVASISSEIIVKVYEQYIVQRAQYKASFKTELTALEIANRLRYAIPRTVYRIRDNNTTEPLVSGMPAGVTGDNYIGLQWVGYDGESFEATGILAAGVPSRKPGWSGLCDLNASSKNAIVTPGSNLALASTIITNLGGNIVNSTIFFPRETNLSVEHNISAINTATTPHTINLTALVPATTPRRLVEHYRLAWTSYALKVENNDLYLYYNFAPSIKAPIGGTRKLLLKNVSTFKFMGTENTIRFKLCVTEDIRTDVNITSCKEKAVF